MLVSLFVYNQKYIYPKNVNGVDDFMMISGLVSSSECNRDKSEMYVHRHSREGNKQTYTSPIASPSYIVLYLYQRLIYIHVLMIHKRVLVS